MPLGERPAFKLTMQRYERILGWCYLPIHVFILPLLLNIYQTVSLNPVSDSTINMVYYIIGIAYVLVLMRRYLREEFDTLLDHKLSNLLSLITAYFLDILLSYFAIFALELILQSIENPNEQALETMAGTDYGVMFGLAVFLAPIVEEVLFRGVIFGSLRENHRVLAFVVSIAAFSLYHVWQYALAYRDVTLLIYAIQYVPVSFVLAWLYDRTGTIWMPIFFHMMINGISMWYTTLG
jgi:hypothetical protein